MADAYITDLRRFLDPQGEIATEMPTEARQFVSFLVLIVDAATQRMAADFEEIGMRCRSKNCRGSILACLDTRADEILWRCPACEQRGVVRNWQGTKWDLRGK